MLFCSDYIKKMNKNMQPEAHSSKALSKEETKGLLTLIEGSRIINNKKTNAINNKMKVEEWVRITNAFNATIGICHRTPQQLRLKWENLKKNSRKRSALMRMDRIKTGGGPPGYFPPDEILERVTALLCSTGEGQYFTGVKRILKQDDGRYARNMAIAKYYNVKRKVLEAELENTILGNEKLKLENEKLKLEIRKLKEE